MRWMAGQTRWPVDGGMAVAAGVEGVKRFV